MPKRIANSGEAGGLKPREELRNVDARIVGGASSRNIGLAKYSQLPVDAEERIAKRFGLGGIRYGVNQWKGGNWEFILERIDHLQEHMRLFRRDGNGNGDDNLSAIGWAVYALCWFEKNKPEEWEKAMDVMCGGKIVKMEKEAT